MVPLSPRSPNAPLLPDDPVALSDGQLVCRQLAWFALQGFACVLGQRMSGKDKTGPQRAQASVRTNSGCGAKIPFAFHFICLVRFLSPSLRASKGQGSLSRKSLFFTDFCFILQLPKGSLTSFHASGKDQNLLIPPNTWAGYLFQP